MFHRRVETTSDNAGHRTKSVPIAQPLFIAGLAVLLAACSASDDSGDTAPPLTTPPPTAVVTTLADTEPPAPTTAPDPSMAVSIDVLLDTRPPGQVAVTGSLIDPGGGFLLCGALAESFPPQCAGRWVVVVGSLEVALVGDSGVQWSDQSVTLVGELVGDRFVIGGVDTEATAADIALVDSFIAYADGTGKLDDLPLASIISLGLSNDLLADRTVDSLADPDSWKLNKNAFRGWVGPFSVLELLAEGRPTEVLVGPHNHCAAHPVPPSDEVSQMRHISVSPSDATSCLEWWTVDFFVNDDGEVAAVTLDLWEP